STMYAIVMAAGANQLAMNVQIQPRRPTKPTRGRTCAPRCVPRWRELDSLRPSGVDARDLLPSGSAAEGRRGDVDTCELMASSPLAGGARYASPSRAPARN